MTLIIFAMVLISATFSDFMTHKNDNSENGFFLIVVGGAGWLGLFFYSQQIINKNQFVLALLVSLCIFIVCQIEHIIFFFKFSSISIIASIIPLAYILYFRLLIFIFFRNYPNCIQNIDRPVIIYASKYGIIDYERRYLGHKPTMKERIFSLLLFLGFIWLILGIIMISRPLFP
jgi:hypothetical protein